MQSAGQNQLLFLYLKNVFKALIILQNTKLNFVIKANYAKKLKR